MSEYDRYWWVQRILVAVFGSVLGLLGVAVGAVATTDAPQSPDPILVLAMVFVFTTTMLVAGLVFVVYLIAEMDVPPEVNR